MDGRTSRLVWRRLALAAVLFALCGGSAAFTASVTRPTAPATQVAVADSVPVLLPVPVAPHATPSGPAPIGTAVTAAGGCISVPILVYHYIRVNPVPTDRNGFLLSVTPAEFQAQMDWLREAGGHPVTLAQVMTALHGGPALPAHPVVLTFDDGHDDFATRAAPILQREGFVGTDFVITGFIGRSSYMTVAQLQRVDAMGMVLGAHTVHHVDLNNDPAQLASIEISASKAALEELLHHPVLDFAYPYGGVNNAVAALVSHAGFRDAVTTNYGLSQCDSQKFWLHRIRVGGPDTVSSFAIDAGVPQPPTGWTDPGLPPPSPSPSAMSTSFTSPWSRYR